MILMNNCSKMAAVSNYNANTDYIFEHLDLVALTDYLVEHNYMTCAHRDYLMGNLFIGYDDDMINRRYCNRRFVENFLYKYIADKYDNLILKSLIATGQKEIVLKIFPDFIETARLRAIFRISTVVADINVDAMVKHIQDNLPGYSYRRRYRIGDAKTHSMTTRNDVKIPIDDMYGVLTSRVLKDNFDVNTDPIFKALSATGHRHIINAIFPECQQRLLFKDP